MYSFLLQDWTTLLFASSVSSVTQSEADWLDLAQFRDAVVWLEVKESGGLATLQIVYETAPTKDETLFSQMGVVTLGAPGVVTTIAVADGSVVPLARWLRWRLTAPGAMGVWHVTFRVWVAANAPGTNRPTANALAATA